MPTASRYSYRVAGRPVDYRSPDRMPDAARRMVRDAWAWLTDAQQAVLRGRYWDGHTAEHLAGVLALPVERVRQTEVAALTLCRRVIAGLYEPATGEPLAVPALT